MATTIVSVEEGLRGWLANINRNASARALIAAYAELGGIVEFHAEWEILPYDAAAHDEFQRLKRRRPIANIKTTDLRIAAIVLSRADRITLLSADRHFTDIARHTRLVVEDWREY